MKLFRIVTALLLLGIADLHAADVKISALPSASALTGTESIAAVQSGSCAATGGTCKTTPAAIATYVVSPASAGQVLYKGSGAVAGSSNFTWDAVNSILMLTGPSGGVIDSASGQPVNIIGGNGLTDLTSGSLTVSAGGGISGAGGNIAINAGNAVTSGAGGILQLNSGSGAGSNQNAGSISITTGSSTGSAAGGTLSLGTHGTNRLTFGENGAWNLNAGNGGTAGQTIISAGISTTPAWGPIDLSNSSAVTNALTVPNGGSGLATLPVHALVVGEGTSSVGNVAAMAADTLLQGRGAAADPAAVSLLNCGDATHALAYSTSTHTFSCQAITGLATPVTVANGGTGLGTLTTHGVMLGEGTSNVAFVAAMAADTILQGQGASADPAAVSVPNCNGASNALSYSTGTHTFGCNSISGGGVTFSQVFKTGNTSRNSTSPTADPDLQFASVPAGNHVLECLILWSNAATTGGIRYGVAVGGTLTTGAFYGASVSNGSGGALAAAVGTGTSAFSAGSATLASGGIQAGINLRVGIITSTTGNVQFGWAENLTDAGNATSVQAGSWCNLT